MAETILTIIDGMKSSTITCTHCAENFKLTGEHLDLLRGYYPAIQTISKLLVIPVKCPKCNEDTLMEIRTISEEEYLAAS